MPLRYAAVPSWPMSCTLSTQRHRTISAPPCLQDLGMIFLDEFWPSNHPEIAKFRYILSFHAFGRKDIISKNRNEFFRVRGGEKRESSSEAKWKNQQILEED